MSSSQLSNDTFCTYLNEQLDIYIKAHDRESTNPSMVWEAAKAYIGGPIIFLLAAEKGKWEGRGREMTTQLKPHTELKALDLQFIVKPTRALCSKSGSHMINTSTDFSYKRLRKHYFFAKHSQF